MKLKTLTIIGAASICAFAAHHVQAEVPQTLHFSLTTYTQRSSSDDGTTTTTPAPKVKTHNTADLLNVLANDEHAAGLFDPTNFPAGSKLVSMNDDIVVMHGSDVLISVTNILNFSNGDANVQIKSGRENDATGLASPTVKRMQIGRITYDSTGILGSSGLHFYLQGVVRDTKTDTKPATTGVYREIRTGTLTNGAGEGGDSDGNDFICTGNISASGHGEQTQ